jgi:hypothetical protein
MPACFHRHIRTRNTHHVCLDEGPGPDAARARRRARAEQTQQVAQELPGIRGGRLFGDCEAIR